MESQGHKGKSLSLCSIIMLDWKLGAFVLSCMCLELQWKFPVIIFLLLKGLSMRIKVILQPHQSISGENRILELLFSTKIKPFVWWFIISLGSMFELMDWFMVDLNWHAELLGCSWWLCALQDYNEMVQLHLFVDFEIETRFASFNRLHCISISFPFINFDCISPLWWDWTGFWIGNGRWLFVRE